MKHKITDMAHSGHSLGLIKHLWTENEFLEDELNHYVDQSNLLDVHKNEIESMEAQILSLENKLKKSQEDLEACRKEKEANLVSMMQGQKKIIDEFIKKLDKKDELIKHLKAKRYAKPILYK